MIYIFMILTSSVSVWCAQKTIYKRNYYLLVVTAILFPCILAGVRNICIGTDVEVYVSTLFESALDSHNIYDFYQGTYKKGWAPQYVNTMDLGFSLLIYLVAFIIGNINVALFLISVIIILPIYKGLVKLREDGVLITISWFAFLTLFYSTTLNAMRQCMAMSLLFYGMTYVFTNNSKAFFKYLTIAFLFHSSALIGILFYFIYKLLYKKIHVLTSKQHRVRFSPSIMVIVLAICSMVIIFNNQILVWLLTVIGFERYTAYIAGVVTFMPTQLIKRLPIFVLIIINWKELIAKYKNIPFLFLMAWFDFLCGLFYSANKYGGRIGDYFAVFNIILLGYICSLKKNKIKYITNLILTFGYLCFYWFFSTVMGNSGETMPYLFWFE